ncbi:cellulase-domain-containing protein [Agrocybe pediades]|nr:cellulase-domain-containing protein [Agrocybe pediades]
MRSVAILLLLTHAILVLANAPSSAHLSHFGAGAKANRLTYVGVNIAGLTFGCTIDGSCNLSSIRLPLRQYSGVDGEGQMQHFVKDDGMNIFRLPVSWQFLTGGVQTAKLNQTRFTEYDNLVQACLNTGAHCVIDVHNYARFNGKIIGQGGPTNGLFSQLWTNIASKYSSESNILFGIMNEPHDMPKIQTWADTVQAAVTAIRRTGATKQIILLPGDNFTAAKTFVSSGSADALSKVVDFDGSTKNLVFDVHQYLDSDNSGTHTECVTNNIQAAWRPFASWLRANGRQALVTETGGGNTDSCISFLCQQNAFLAQNSDVFLGYLGWAAGSFASNYELNGVPTWNGNKWVDTPLVKRCISPNSSSQG